MGSQLLDGESFSGWRCYIYMVGLIEQFLYDLEMKTQKQNRNNKQV